MAEQQHHHHHHHHRKDGATRFKERSLRAIELQKTFEKWLKILLIIVACLMVIAVIAVYKFG